MAEKVQSRILLVIFWFCGLLYGFTAAALFKDFFLQILYQIPIIGISVSSLVVKLFIFLLITVIALILGKPWIFYPAALLKAFCMSYTATAFSCISDIEIGTAVFYGLPNMLLILFWLRYITGFTSNAFRVLVIFTMLHVAVYLFFALVCYF